MTVGCEISSDFDVKCILENFFWGPDEPIFKISTCNVTFYKVVICVVPKWVGRD